MPRSLLSLSLPKHVLSALTRNGYESVADISSVKPEVLSQTLQLTLADIHDMLAKIQRPHNASAPSFSHPASSMVRTALSSRVSTRCPPLDELLDGGLSPGQILEVSGPPGSPKERIVIGILKSFLELGNEAIFIDCQNMTPPQILNDILPTALRRLVHYQAVHTLLDFLVLIHHLPQTLKSRPKYSLLVVNSVSFPFQNPSFGVSQRNYHLEHLKQTLFRVSAINNVTIVLTSQLSTKMVNADGTSGTFDTGGRGVMLPSLGLTYLPSAKSSRILLAQDGLFSGVMELLPSPEHSEKAHSVSRSASYTIINGQNNQSP